MKPISKKTWIISGLILAGLTMTGKVLDTYFQNDNFFQIIGLAIGFFIMAYMVYTDKGASN